MIILDLGRKQFPEELQQDIKNLIISKLEPITADYYITIGQIYLFSEYASYNVYIPKKIRNNVLFKQYFKDCFNTNWFSINVLDFL